MKANKIREIEEIIQSYNKENELANFLKNELVVAPCFILKKTEESTIFGGLHIHELYEMLYVKSGTLSYQIEGVHYELKEGDILISTEISRLGRSLLEVMSILQNCLTKNCEVWTLKENYRLGSDIGSKVLAFAFSLSAEIERKLISDRTKMSLNKLKAQGVQLGRPIGQQNRELKLSKNKKKIQRMLNEGMPRTHIARIFNVNKTTFYRFLDRYDMHKEK